MGRPRKWGSDAERMQVRREREALVAGDYSGLEQGQAVAPVNVEPSSEPPEPGGVVIAGVKLTPASEIEAPQEELLPVLPVNRPAPELEAYVAEAREGARIVAEQKPKRLLRVGQSVRERDQEYLQDIEDRVAKAEAYARWRWHGYQAGEVASL